MDRHHVVIPNGEVASNNGDLATTHMRRQPRKLTRWVFELVAGLLITLMLAGIVRLFPLPWTTTVRVGNEALQLYQNAAEYLGGSPTILSGPDGYDTITCKMILGFGFAHRVFTCEKPYPPKMSEGGITQWTAGSTAQVTEFGWPLHCFIADEVPFIGVQLKQNPISKMQELISKSVPMPLPLLMNVIIFTLAVHFSPGLSRRVRTTYRIWQGRCRACGYPRGSSPVCSECGCKLP